MSLGTKYNICNTCNKAFEDEVCIVCGQPIIGQLSIKGKCQACSQEEYEEKQRKIEEAANGIDDGSELYYSGVEFTEEDYERWVTFGQGNFTPERIRQNKLEWLRKRLAGQGGWSKELIDANIDSIEQLMDKHASRVREGRYLIVYYDGSKGTRVTEFVDKIGHIFMIKRK